MRKYSQNLKNCIGDSQEERECLESNGRDITGTQWISNGAVETDHPGLPEEWAEQQGVLSAARDLGKNILLLAAKTAHSGGGAGSTSNHGIGAEGG